MYTMIFPQSFTIYSGFLEIFIADSEFAGMWMTKYNMIPAIISALRSCSVRSKHLNNIRECRMYKRFNSSQEYLLNEETGRAKSLFL